MAVSPDDIVTVSDAAEILGVSVSSIKRWVDDGTLPAVKTSGGHRRLKVSDLLELARGGISGGINLDFFRKKQGTSGNVPDPASVYRELLDHARNCRPVEITHALDRARTAGMSLQMAGDEVIFPLMDEIGRLWQEGQLDVAEEHLATRAINDALGRWKEAVGTRAGAGRQRLAVGACPPGDHSMLGNFLVEIMLLERGWRVLNLGPNTPFDTLASVARDQGADLVWLTCTHLADEDAFATWLQTLHSRLKGHGAALFLGGRALHGNVRRRLTYDWMGDTLAQMARALEDRFPTSPGIEERDSSLA